MKTSNIKTTTPHDARWRMVMQTNGWPAIYPKGPSSPFITFDVTSPLGPKAATRWAKFLCDQMNEQVRQGLPKQMEQTQSTGPGTDGFRRKYGEDPYPAATDKSFIAGDGTKGWRVWMHEDAVAEIKRLGIELDQLRAETDKLHAQLAAAGKWEE